MIDFLARVFVCFISVIREQTLITTREWNVWFVMIALCIYTVNSHYAQGHVN